MKIVLVLGRHKGTILRDRIAGIDATYAKRHFIDYPNVYNKLGHGEFQRWLVKLCSDFNISILIVDAINGFYHFDQETFTILLALNVRLIGTCFDNSTEQRFYLNCYQQFEGVIVTSSRTRFIFDSVGINSQLYWPQIPNFERYLARPSLYRTIDCSFVGSLKANRSKFIENINRMVEPVSLAIFGSDTSNGRVTKIRYWEILSTSKITLNFNRQDHHAAWVALDPHSNWCSIPTLRNLEAGIAGTLCLAEWVPEYDDLFPGFDDLTFVNTEEAAAKIKYFLDHPEILLKRSRDYQNRCLELHQNPLLFGSLLEKLSDKANEGQHRRIKRSRGEIYEEPMFRLKKCIFFAVKGRYFLAKGKLLLGLGSVWRCLKIIPSLHMYLVAFPILRLSWVVESLGRKR